MKIYPLLEELSKAGAKNAVLGLLQADQNAAADTEPRGDFSLKMERDCSGREGGLFNHKPSCGPSPHVLGYVVSRDTQQYVLTAVPEKDALLMQSHGHFGRE